MKLQQLRYAQEVYRRNLNISEAAEALYTSQPGISKQIRLLEDELGVQIFVRSGKRIVAVTEPGMLVLQSIEHILGEVGNIKKVGLNFAQQDEGCLTLAASPTWARYHLPQIVEIFMHAHPKVRLLVKSAQAAEAVQWVTQGEADLALVSESVAGSEGVVYLPCSQWHYAVLVPQGHDLAVLGRPITLHDLAAWPWLGYENVCKEDSVVAAAFRQALLPLPSVLLASSDPEMIKNCVRRGMGIGVVDRVAYVAQADPDLVCLDTAHLFHACHTRIALKQHAYLRSYLYEFLRLLSAQLSKDRVDQYLYASSQEDYSI